MEKKMFILFLLEVFLTSGLFGGEGVPVERQQKIGFNYGYGSQLAMNVQYVYKVNLFHLQYFHPILTYNNFALEFGIQPNYSRTIYETSPNETDSKGYEYGLIIGLLVRKYFINDKLNLYMIIGTGPQFVSGTPPRQAAGFIFSDNLFLGISTRVHRYAFLDMRIGFRHISNANLKEPNNGIDNLILEIGFHRPFIWQK